MSLPPPEKLIHPRPCGWGFTDHTFPSSSGTTLAIRIWPARDPTAGPRPWILWTHGGGFLGGSHHMPRAWIDPGFRHHLNYHLVAHSYRLAPQASVTDQLADCVESVAWCRAHLPALLGGDDKVDVDRYVLCGESAGGYLVTLAALHLPDPQPRAVVDLYGVVDLFAMFTHDRDADAEPEPWRGEFAETKLRAFLEDRDRANVMTEAFAWIEIEMFNEAEMTYYWGTEVRYTDRLRLQSEVHNWRMRHPRGNRLLRGAILHPERFGGDEKKVDELAAEMSPLLVLRKRLAEGKETKYPPTAFLHGTADVDVPLSHPKDMAAVLRQMGVPVVESYEEGVGHVFDQKYTGPEIPGWDKYIQPILEFVDHHVSRA
ncbi:hypothetical protein QBC47DRAFT_438493 [Echria macrotheca]|uniref:Uncharacterized protein n=1 Tax=Echria macrotheca TaxID=438768 RepID=A0AAJ0B2P4_9PEZI|nr:hypothetical protein QBC47DRAFT_438493 [Echria macrotheca]